MYDEHISRRVKHTCKRENTQLDAKKDATMHMNMLETREDERMTAHTRGVSARTC